MDATLILCEGLVKIYKTHDLEVFALQGLDLTVRRGELMAIIGNSGSGKSTLLNILGGVDLPSAGQVTVGGWDLTRLGGLRQVRYRREMVGFVWQNSARNLIGYLTAVENVELPMVLAGRPHRQRAGELLRLVGLEERLHHRRLSQMSGGEQQRVAIALALANNPPLILADEPTGAVDTRTAGIILEIFRSLNREYGTTVVIVTHDQALARQVDRFVLIRDGRTSTEAVRHAEAGAAAGQQEQPVHEELAVIDSAGRLQLPRDLMDEVGLGDRARLEVEEGRIVIRRPDSGPAVNPSAPRRGSHG